jgi:hypothetical protein
MSDDDRKVLNFRCRAQDCNGTTYSPLYRPSSVHDIIGSGRGSPTGYMCDKCTSPMGDPGKWSLNQPPIYSKEKKEVKPPLEVPESFKHLLNPLGPEEFKKYIEKETKLNKIQEGG